jgi:hypothetical protein
VRSREISCFGAASPVRDHVARRLQRSIKRLRGIIRPDKRNDSPTTGGLRKLKKLCSAAAKVFAVQQAGIGIAGRPHGNFPDNLGRACFFLFVEIAKAAASEKGNARRYELRGREALAFSIHTFHDDRFFREKIDQAWFVRYDAASIVKEIEEISNQRIDICAIDAFSSIVFAHAISFSCDFFADGRIPVDGEGYHSSNF